MFDLDGRIALVTGAARGIGREIARALTGQGALVFATDLHGEEPEGFNPEGDASLRYLSLDVTSPEQWAAAADHVASAFGRLDILVNNAGMMRSKSFFDTDIEDFRATMQVNAESVFLGAKAMLPLLRKGGEANAAGASIINIASVYAEIAGSWNTAYCASKGAVRMLTKALAVDLAQARTNIRVNVVQPGAIDTTMLRNSLGAFIEAGVIASADQADQMVTSLTPMGRMGRPDDIAGVVAFLASDAAKFMTGAVITPDGGISSV
jgi:NAD(P)-dependent dehydrogenase (short-subunit alcohol dehydrogenase family)